MKDGVVDQRVLYWSQQHAVVMLAAIAAVMAGFPLVLLVAAVWLSLLWYLYQVRSVWFGSRLFVGVANCITLFRLFLLSTIVLIYPEPSTVTCGWILIFILCLDGIDGMAARRFSESSLAGQYLDVEVDAFAIAAMGLLLTQNLGLSLLFVFAGALRYLYILLIRYTIREERAEPKRQYASVIAVLAYVAMVLELAFNHMLTFLFLSLVMLLLGGSFIRSFIYQWQGR